MIKSNHPVSFYFPPAWRSPIFWGIALAGLLAFGEIAAAQTQAPQQNTLTTDRKIALFEKEAARDPEKIPARNRLAQAYIQKGRETADAAYFQRAERLLESVLATSPKDGEALGLRGWVALFKHQFKEAAAWGERARAAQPKVSFHYGVLSDAYLEMGDYPRAIGAAQKMIDLKPDQGAYSRAAHLRSLYGDAEGAIVLWRSAIQAGSPDSENTAWCQAELGDEYFNTGKLKEAEAAYRGALKSFPGYHRGFVGLARLRWAEQKNEEAADLYQQAIDRVPYPHYFASLGDLYLAMGKDEDAQKQFALVEQIAKLDRINQVLYNRDLALFYADHSIHLAEAVGIAEKELELRKDIYTYDHLAWVYYQNKRYPEAARAIQKALRLGTEDPKILFHAGMVSRALGKEKEAKRFLNRALALNPHFHPLYEKSAREALRLAGFHKGELS